MPHLCGRMQHSPIEQQGPLQHPELAQGRLLADESHREDPQLAGITEEVNCGTQGGLTSSIEMDEALMLFQMKEARMLQEKERLQQEEISKLDQQLDQRRRKLCKMEEMEAQLKAQLKSLTRREGGSGSGGGGGSRDRHQFGHQSPNSSLLHSGQHHGQLHGQHQGQHHGQQWIGNNLPGGRSPGDEP